MSMSEVSRTMKARGWLDFHQATLSRIEKGERPARLGEAQELADIFNTSLARMSMGTPAPQALEDLLAQSRRIKQAILDFRKAGAELVNARKGLSAAVEKGRKLDPDRLTESKRQVLSDAIGDAELILEEDPETSLKRLLQALEESGGRTERLEGQLPIGPVGFTTQWANLTPTRQEPEDD